MSQYVVSVNVIVSAKDAKQAEKKIKDFLQLFQTEFKSLMAHCGGNTKIADLLEEVS
jgi:hypothetical protein